jgi:thiamine pyrophosphate-dependent acetolactate synthase large subunit-like protein
MARALVDAGVAVMFGVVGDANVFLVHSYVSEFNGCYVSAANEGGAVLMANGYGRAADTVGVATVTHGPGLTNTCTALVEAVRARTPLLLIAGDTSADMPGHSQNIYQRDVVHATGATFVEMRRPGTALVDLALAIRTATEQQRPVVLNVPADFQWADIEYESLPRRAHPPQLVEPDPAVLDGVVGIVASARRPVVLAGAGANRPDARDSLLSLAQRIGAPVATTLAANGLFDGDSHNLGIFGSLSSPIALRAIASSDCILAFGTSWNRRTTLDGALLHKKQVVRCDLDPAQLAHSRTAGVEIVGDAAAVADALIAYLDEAGINPTKYRSDELATELRESHHAEYIDDSTATTVDIRTALKRIDLMIPSPRTLVVDGGRFVTEVWNRVTFDPLMYIHAINFGSIGLGVASAVGASYGAPDRPTLLVTGDGGFMLGGLAEFNTAVRHNVDLIVVILNDRAYGAEHIQLRERDLDPAICMFDWPDLAMVATALGGQGVRVSNLTELDAVEPLIKARTRPMLIDISIDPDKVHGVGH